MGHFSAHGEYGASWELEKQWGHLQVVPGPAPRSGMGEKNTHCDDEPSYDHIC